MDSSNTLFQSLFKGLPYLLMGVVIIGGSLWMLLSEPNETSKDDSSSQLDLNSEVLPEFQSNLADAQKPQCTSFPKLAWDEGAKQSYALKMQLAVDVFAEGPSQDPQHSLQLLEGLLNLRVLRNTGEQAFVGIQLSSLQVFLGKNTSAELEKRYSPFIIVVFHKNGRPLHYYFPSNLAEDDQVYLKSLIAQLQVVMPDEGKFQWETVENNSLGQYIAAYTLSSNQCDTFYKHTNRYLEVMSQDKQGVENALSFSAKVVESASRVIIGERSSWVQEYAGSETISVASEDRIWSTSKVSFALRQQAPDLNAPLDIWQHQGSVEDLITQLDSLSSEGISLSFQELKRREQLQQRFANTSLSDLFQQLVDEIDSKRTSGTQQVEDLRLFLELYPEATSRLHELMTQKALSRHASAGVIFALEKVGHAEAQQLLRYLLTDDENYPLFIRNQAVMAAGGLDEPEEETIDALWSLVELAKSNERLDFQDQGNTALLSLGRASRQFDKEKAKEVVDRLLEEAEEAEEKEDVNKLWNALEGIHGSGRIDLTAAENTNIQEVETSVDPTAAEECSYAADSQKVFTVANRNVDHSATRVTQASLFILAKCNGVEAQERITGTLDSKEPEKRQAAVSALFHRAKQQSSTEEYITLAKHITQESEVSIQRSIVQQISMHKTPEVVEILKESLSAQLPRETVREIYKAIYENPLTAGPSEEAVPQ